MTTGFLPQINNGNNNGLQITGPMAHSPVNLGAYNFRSPQGGRMRNSPMKRLSLTDRISPTEMVSLANGFDSGNMGIKGYHMPITGSPKRARPAVMPKSKVPSIIEQEAKYRSNFPSSASYVLKSSLPWDQQANNKRPFLPKAPRRSEIDMIGINAKKPEKSTPSPNAYDTNQKLKILPNLVGGAGASMAAKSERISPMVEAAMIGARSPGPDYNIDINKFKKRAHSILFDKTEGTRGKPLKRDHSMDFYESREAHKTTIKKEPVYSFSHSKKASFAEQVAQRKANLPGPGAHSPDKAWNSRMLSNSPSRKRF